MSLEALRDAYGDALCLSACDRDAEPGIGCAKVLASRMTSVPGGGLRTLANWGRLLKTLLLLVYAGSTRKALAFSSTYGRGLCGMVRSRARAGES